MIDDERTQEAALFCPSGTMTNQLALRYVSGPLRSILCHSDAHIYRSEAGGAALAYDDHSHERVMEL